LYKSISGFQTATPHIENSMLVLMYEHVGSVFVSFEVSRRIPLPGESSTLTLTDHRLR